MTTRGLVVGKFYPPHRGHKFLIDTATRSTDKVHVIVCDKPGEDPPAVLRAAWLRTPDRSVHRRSLRRRRSAVWAENSRRSASPQTSVQPKTTATVRRLPRLPTFSWTGQDRYAISGTRWGTRSVAGSFSNRRCAVTTWHRSHRRDQRADELANDTAPRSESLGSGVRNTGNTSEPNTWRTEEFAEIALEQCRREDAAARLCNRVLVCDTDAFTTRVWHHRYMGAWSPVVDAISAEHRRPDLYLLTDLNTPFEQDGTRDGERIREWMHQTIVEQLAAHFRPFIELKGSRSERMAIAVAAVERISRTRTHTCLVDPRGNSPNSG